MKEYLSSIIIISIAMCIFELLAPESKTYSKYIKLIGALCIIGVIIAPIAKLRDAFDSGFLEDLKDQLTENDKGNLADDYNSILNEYLNNYSVEEYENQIKEILLENFNIPTEECEVDVFTDFTNESLSITKIQILLMGNSIFQNPYNIEEYITKICSAPCKVLIKRKDISNG